MEVSVVNIKGEDTGRKIVLNDTVFGIEPNDHAIYLDVKQYLANQRHDNGVVEVLTQACESRSGTVHGGQFDWGGLLPKGNGGVRRSPRYGRTSY